MIGRDALAFARAKPLAPSAEIVAFGHRASDEYVSVINNADGPITAEMFNLGRSPVTKALRRQSERGVPTTMTLDWRAAEKPYTEQLATSGTTLSTYDATKMLDGPNLRALHSKAIVAGDRGMISTGTMTSLTPQKLELSALVRGEASRALRELIDAGRDGDAAAIRRTAAAALDHGIVITDPLGGVRTINHEMNSLVDEATRDLQLVTKELDDLEFTKRIIGAHGRGVKTRLVVGDLADADASALRAAGIPVERMPFRNRGLDAVLQHRLHFTSLMRDDATRGYFGSQYAWNPGPTGEGREMGVVVEGALARRTQDAIDQQIDRSMPAIVSDMLKTRATSLADDPMRTALVAGSGSAAAAGGAALLDGDVV